MAIFLPKNVKKSENGNKLAKNTLRIAFLQELHRKMISVDEILFFGFFNMVTA
jgi:hypothetical protein